MMVLLSVQQALEKKVSTRQVVSKYYLWKRSEDFKEWQKLRKARKLRRTTKVVKQLSCWANDLNLERNDYHHQLCELCATGGDLVSCNGCPRAYHFSCAQPRIMKVSNDDQWFCTYCRKVFGGPKPKVVASEENKHCMIYYRGPTFPRSLIDMITDAGSDDDEDEPENYLSEKIEDMSRSESNSEMESDDNELAKPDSGLETVFNVERKGDSESEPKNSLAASPLVSEPKISGESVLTTSSSVELVMPLSKSSVQNKVVVHQPVLGRKRLRKTLTPRRIAPSL
ncbi:putative Zinc finger, PHD-type, Zinc finger, FYVE/PHD-type, Zinc finger, RING/FYVE/PHD-type [Plasmopara halstedii]